MSSNVLKIWFSYACQHLGDISNACLFSNDEKKQQFILVGSTSADFSNTNSIKETVNAAVMRRKSLVTIVASGELDEVNELSTAVNATFRPENTKYYLVTSPLIIDKVIIGVACFEFKHQVGSQSPDYLTKVESAVIWLRCLSQIKPAHKNNDAEYALKITAISLSQQKSTDAFMAVASELENCLNCKRVSIGLVENNHVKLHTISSTSQETTRQNIIKSIESVMLEAIDQGETICYPPHSTSYYSTQEHDVFIRKHSGEFICTVPFVINDVIVGAVMFERQGESAVFDKKSEELCEQLTSIFSPILHYRRMNDRPIKEKIKDTIKSLFTNILGSDYLGSKFIAAIVLCVMILSFYINIEYKVSANANLIGSIERVITSPEEGFIKTASMKPGDLVEAGEELATLDDRNLKLEILKWTGKHLQVSKEYRKALAIHDLSKIGVLRSQLKQAEAQMEILQLKLQRTVITSPISAIIVSGDFTRELGAPVKRGQVLYKVSPLEEYNVVININESDISLINVGMTGELTLSAAAEKSFIINIIKITPVLTSENGINYFQVEARLQSKPDFLRPGMQGIAKIGVGEYSILWVFTHKIVNWLRLKIWSWW